MKTFSPMFLTVLSAVLLLAGVPGQAVTVPNGGTLNVTVLDENGAVVPSAPIFIYTGKRNQRMGGREIPGTATLSMPAGMYRISSAIIRKTGEYIDRFASSEASVEIVAGDNTVVTLHLHPLNDTIPVIGMSDAHTIGVDSQVARTF